LFIRLISNYKGQIKLSLKETIIQTDAESFTDQLEETNTKTSILELIIS